MSSKVAPTGPPQKDSSVSGSRGRRSSSAHKRKSNGSSGGELEELTPSQIRLKSTRKKAGEFINNRFVQGVIYLGLFIALFGLDFYTVADIDDSADFSLHVILFIIFIIFIVEIVVQSFAFTEEYLDGGTGFYFWTDFVGTISMIFDIPWLTPLGDASNQGGILRASKAARVGARVARLLKLTRAIKMMRAMRVQSILKAVADVVTEQIARKIAMLVMLMAIIVPLMNVAETDMSIQTQANVLQTVTLDDLNAPYTQGFETTYVNAFWGNEVDGSSVPFKVQFVNTTTNAILLTWERPDFNSNFNRESNILEVTSLDDTFVVFCDQTDSQVWSAWINIMMVLIVVFMLMLFSTLLHRVVMQGVINPMERIFTTINDAMQGAFDMDASDLDTSGSATTAKALEESVAKLARILKSRERSGVEHALEEGNEEQNKWVLQNASRDLMASKERDKNQGGRQSSLVEQNAAQRNSFVGTIVTSDDDDELRSELDSWGYNCFEYDDEALLTQAVTMIAMMKFDIQFNVRVPVMRRFAIEIRKQYLNNPYHNFRHGVDVMQSVFWMSRKIDFERHLPSVEMFALLTAALSHDVGHPGTNNAFLVNTSSPLALRYNDLSVLENMHASIMFITMGGKSEEDNTMNIFSGMSKTDFIIARKTAIKSILMTDNSHHFKCINDIKVMLEVHQDKHERGDSIFIDSEKQRMFLCGLLLHVSDISNPMRHWKASSKAAFNVMEEFFLQGDQEKKRNMKVSMLCDREKENIPKSQMGFIDFFVSPLTEQFLNLFPECGTDFATELVANRLRWQNMYITTLDAKEQDVKGKELREKYDGWKKKWETYLDDGHEVADVKVDEEAMGTMQKLKSGLVKRMSIVKMMGSGSSSGNSRSNSGEKK